MKLLNYVKHFFFIAFNWNFRLAFFTLYHEIKGEDKYGIETSKLSDLRHFDIKGNNLIHAEMYQGANYFLLEKLFSYLQSSGINNDIIDFGCGKGRVLVVAAYHGFSKITGIEFARELCDIAQKNIAPLRIKFPDKIFNVLHVNAVDYIIDNNATVFFFFNPFDERVMLTVVKNILRSLKVALRDVYVVYVNPVHKEIFLSARFEEIYHFQKLRYVHASILKKSVEDF